MPVVTVLYPDDPSHPTSVVQGVRHRVWLAASHLNAVTVVAALGAVDAGNADGVAACVTSHLGARRWLLLDLSGLTFFATHGVSALHHIDLTCARRGIAWVVVPSAEVWRVLRICDSRATLPVAATAAGGLHILDGRPRRHLQLV